VSEERTRAISDLDLELADEVVGGKDAIIQRGSLVTSSQMRRSSYVSDAGQRQTNSSNDGGGVRPEHAAVLFGHRAERRMSRRMSSFRLQQPFRRVKGGSIDHDDDDDDDDDKGDDDIISRYGNGNRNAGGSPVAGRKSPMGSRFDTGSPVAMGNGRFGRDVRMAALPKYSEEPSSTPSARRLVADAIRTRRRSLSASSNASNGKAENAETDWRPQWLRTLHSSQEGFGWAEDRDEDAFGLEADDGTDYPGMGGERVPLLAPLCTSGILGEALHSLVLVTAGSTRVYPMPRKVSSEDAAGVMAEEMRGKVRQSHGKRQAAQSAAALFAERESRPQIFGVGEWVGGRTLLTEAHDNEVAYLTVGTRNSNAVVMCLHKSQIL